MTTELHFERSILDPVHGLIHLTSEEVRIIDTAIFRRLRGTKQNGLLWLVFPSATHTRFEHSLGVLYVADVMWHALLANARMGATKSPPRVASLQVAKDGQAVDLSELNDASRVLAQRVLRIAALCHDLGHGPLSHTFDKFAPTVADLRRFMNDPALEPIVPLLEGWVAKKCAGMDPAEADCVRIDHEVMSCVFMTLIWQGQDGEGRQVLLAATSAILGPDLGDAYRYGITDKTLKRSVPLLHDMVASAPADADRMDYLLRDTLAIGVSYGQFDRNRVMKSLLCYVDRASPEHDFRLGLKRSGLRAIENLIQARFELFVQIYYHKTNGAITLMLNAIAESVAASTLFPWHDLRSTTEVYCDLDDEEFLRRLSTCSDPEVKELVRRVRGRELWKRIVDISVKLDEDGNVSKELTEEEGDQMVQRLRAAVGEADLQFDLIDPKATKDLDGGAALLGRGSDGVYRAAEKTNWMASSPIIKTLGEVERAIARIYSRSEDSATIAQLRQEALNAQPL